MTHTAEDLVRIAAGLRGLLAKATPGPWQAPDDDASVWDTRADGEPGVPLFNGASDRARSWGRRRNVSEIADDAALIVAAVNALPALLNQLDAAEAERTVMQARIVALEAGLFEALHALFSRDKSAGRCLLAREYLASQEPTDARNLLYSGQQMIAAFKAGQAA